MTANCSRPETPDLSGLGDADLIRLRAALHGEMKRRGLAHSVGQVAEKLAIDFFNNTPGFPNLREAAAGTANVDALSRRGHRYSIKGVLDARKTGTVYPDPEAPDRQLFEYLLIIQLNTDWTMQSIHEFDWPTFVRCRSWDKRMNAWYVGLAAKRSRRRSDIFPHKERCETSNSPALVFIRNPRETPTVVRRAAKCSIY